MSRRPVDGRKALHPAKPFPGLPEAPPVRLRLVADDRSGTMERRRHDCARLATCELDWIRAHGGAQAMCPTACIRYEREPRREVALLSGGGIVVGGAL